jgi:hypothetical protein
MTQRSARTGCYMQEAIEDPSRRDESRASASLRTCLDDSRKRRRYCLASTILNLFTPSSAIRTGALALRAWSRQERHGLRATQWR